MESRDGANGTTPGVLGLKTDVCRILYPWGPAISNSKICTQLKSLSPCTSPPLPLAIPSLHTLPLPSSHHIKSPPLLLMNYLPQPLHLSKNIGSSYPPPLPLTLALHVTPPHPNLHLHLLQLIIFHPRDVFFPLPLLPKVISTHLLLPNLTSDTTSTNQFTYALT